MHASYFCTLPFGPHLRRSTHLLPIIFQPSGRGTTTGLHRKPHLLQVPDFGQHSKETAGAVTEGASLPLDIFALSARTHLQ